MKKNINFFLQLFLLFIFFDFSYARDLSFSEINAGKNNVTLNVVQSGTSSQGGFLFIHGNGQNYYSWIKQLNSNLNKKYHLASFDLRGHGNSGKPNSIHDYNKACVWAEDIRSVMLETNLRKPILVGWSFGGLIIMHYINCFGVDEISGIVLVSSRSRLVNLSTLPNPHAIESQIFLREKEFKKRKRGAEIFTRLLTYHPLENKTYNILKLSSLMVPPYVREFIATPILDYNSEVISSYSFLIPKIKVPLTVIVGGKDSIRDTKGLIKAFRRDFPRAEIIKYDDIGHSPHLEDPSRFNGDLIRIAKKISFN